MKKIICILSFIILSISMYGNTVKKHNGYFYIGMLNVQNLNDTAYLEIPDIIISDFVETLMSEYIYNVDDTQYPEVINSNEYKKFNTRVIKNNIVIDSIPSEIELFEDNGTLYVGIVKNILIDSTYTVYTLLYSNEDDIRNLLNDINGDSHISYQIKKDRDLNIQKQNAFNKIFDNIDNYYQSGSNFIIGGAVTMSIGLASTIAGICIYACGGSPAAVAALWSLGGISIGISLTLFTVGSERQINSNVMYENFLHLQGK